MHTTTKNIYKPHKAYSQVSLKKVSRRSKKSKGNFTSLGDIHVGKPQEIKLRFFKKKTDNPPHFVKIRILDFIFPFDITCITFNTEQNPNFFAPIGVLKYIKRAVLCIRDNDEFIWQLEELNGNVQQYWKGYQNISFFNNFLLGLNHPVTNYLNSCLGQYCNYIDRVEKIKGLSTYDKNLTKAFFIELSKEQTKTLKENPYMYLGTNLSLSSGKGQIETIKVSRSMAEMLEYPDAQCMVDFEDYLIFYHLISKNWMLYYINLFQFLENKASNYLKWDQDVLYMVDRSKNKIEGDIYYYKRTYLQDCDQIKEDVYIVFIKKQEVEIVEEKVKDPEVKIMEMCLETKDTESLCIKIQNPNSIYFNGTEDSLCSSTK